MHLNHRLEDQPVEARIRDLSKTSRSREFQPLLHLKGIEAFGTLIHRRLVNCRSAGKRPAVMLLAFDALEGAETGSELLAALGARVRSRVRATDLVAQIDSRFAVYLDGDVAAHAASIRERLTAALLEEFSFGDVSVRIRPRFGMAIHPGTPIGGIDLVNAAARAIED